MAFLRCILKCKLKTQSFESILLKQSNPAFKVTRNLQFIWQFTMLSFFQMTPAWSVHLRLGNVFWRIRLRETILTGHWIQWVQLYRAIDKTHVWRFRFMSSSKNLFVNFYLDFNKIENVRWKSSADNLHEFYRIWCNIFKIQCPFSHLSNFQLHNENNRVIQFTQYICQWYHAQIFNTPSNDIICRVLAAHKGPDQRELTRETTTSSQRCPALGSRVTRRGWCRVRHSQVWVSPTFRHL